MTELSAQLGDLTADQKRELLAQLLKEESQRVKSTRLSFAQERLWFLDQLQPGSPAYNVPMVIGLTSPDVSLLERALDEIVSRHEALRTTFSFELGNAVQVVAPSLRVPLRVTDLRGLPIEERAREAARLAREEARTPFDLTTGPLLRAELIARTDTDYDFLLTLHHIVCDGWSSGVLFQELNALYEAYTQGRRPQLDQLRVQYPEFAAWQRGWLQGETLDRQLGYWVPLLRGAPPLLDLPTDRPRPAVQSFAGAIQPFQLTPSLSRAVERLSQAEGTTPFMTLLAAFKTLLMRYSGQDDVVVGTPIAGRTRPELEPIIGFFVNTLVLRTDLGDDPTFRELLARVKSATLGAYAHQDLPFELLVDELQPERRMSHNPVFQVMFALQNLPAVSALSNTGADREDEEPDEDDPEFRFQPGTETSKFDLTLSMGPDPNGLIMAFEYNTELFEHATIRRMYWHLRTLLASIVEGPDRRLSELNMLGSAEHRRLGAGRDAATGLQGEPALATALRRSLADALRSPQHAGSVLSGARLHVLDAGLGLLPTGIFGEVHVGVEHAPGELSDKAAARLVPHPVDASPLYPTGERARWRRDGTLDGLGPGRRFHSGGYAIEPLVVERALTSHPAIHDAAVMRVDAPDGTVHAVAYIEPDSHVADGLKADLARDARRALQARLPDYLIPVDLVVVDRLARGRDGQVDAGALPAADLSAAVARTEYVAPRTPTEAVIARIWLDVLDHERIGVFDSFFDVGGNSLASIRILGRIEDRLGVALPLVRLFENPTIASLADAVDSEQGAGRDGGADGTHELAGTPALSRSSPEALP